MTFSIMNASQYLGRGWYTYYLIRHGPKLRKLTGFVHII
jgi:hypothetical protein